MSAPDAFALGGWQSAAPEQSKPDHWKGAPDAEASAAILWAEHTQLTEWIEGLNGDLSPEVDRVVEAWMDRREVIEEEVAGRLARTRPDLIAQVRLLAHWNKDIADDFSDGVVNKLIAGIAILGVAE